MVAKDAVNFAEGPLLSNKRPEKKMELNELSPFYKLHHHRPQAATNHVSTFSTTFIRNEEFIGRPIPDKRNERKVGRQAPEP